MTVKEVSIAMTPTEEKAITRLQTRRKRIQKKMIGGEEPVQESPAELVAAPVVAPVVAPVAAPVVAAVAAPVVAPVVAPAAPVSVQPAISESQTGGSKIHIVSHKKNQTRTAPQASGAAKILPTKRHVTVKRKPTLVIGKQQGGQQSQQLQTVTPTAPTQPVPASLQQPQTVTPTASAPSVSVPVQPQTMTPTAAAPPVSVPVQPQNVIPTTPTQPTVASQKGGALKKKRFTERRLSISVKHLKSTRRHKKSIRRKVKSMDIQAIRVLLTEKGILTGKSNPPEKMLRSMMKDYLLLQANAK